MQNAPQHLLLGEMHTTHSLNYLMQHKLYPHKCKTIPHLTHTVAAYIPVSHDSMDLMKTANRQTHMV